MTSVRDIQRHMVSIQNTHQITKAMKLVATAKLRKSRENAENSRPYFEYMNKTVKSILSLSSNTDYRFLRAGKSAKKAVIAITSNRGLAGGYNSNVVKLIAGDTNFAPEGTLIYNIGRKGGEMLRRKGYEIYSDFSEAINKPAYAEAANISEKLLDDFEKDVFGELYIAYTKFKNAVSHDPAVIKMLPISSGDIEEDDANLYMNYEPCPEDVLDVIIPEYVSSFIYGGLVESAASENGARMQAMDVAASNAEDMIEELSALYNRVRQGNITQELTEIISGSEAI